MIFVFSICFFIYVYCIFFLLFMLYFFVFIKLGLFMIKLFLVFVFGIIILMCIFYYVCFVFCCWIWWFLVWWGRFCFEVFGSFLWLFLDNLFLFFWYYFFVIMRFCCILDLLILNKVLWFGFCIGRFFVGYGLFGFDVCCIRGVYGFIGMWRFSISLGINVG